MLDIATFSRRFFVLLPCILTACSLFAPQLQPPEVLLRAVVLERLSFDEQHFRIRLRLRNPNERELRVAEARIRIRLEDVDLGEGFTLEPVSVPALGESDVEVRLATNLVAKVPEILGWLTSGDTQLDYRLTGFVDLGGVGMVRLDIDEVGQVQLTDINRYTRPRR
jgi:LEA14-like dessication related protein